MGLAVNDSRSVPEEDFDLMSTEYPWVSMLFAIDAFLISAREKRRKSCASPPCSRVALLSVMVTVLAVASLTTELIPTLSEVSEPSPLTEGPLISSFSFARKGFLVEVVATQQRPKSPERKVTTIVPPASICFEIGSSNA